jgi:cytochrome b561
MIQRDRFPLRSRLFHWATAALVFTALLVGFVMVNSLNSYAALRSVHITLGISILVITIARAANRFTHHAPPLPNTVGPLEHKLAVGSELSMYGLLMAQPVVGWAMVSATGKPIAVFGAVHLPAIAPFNADAYFVLRQAHSVLAYLLVAAIAAHVSAVLLHTLTLRDGMLSRMAFGRGLDASQRRQATEQPDVPSVASWSNTPGP